MNALISGARSLLGVSLLRALRWEGHNVRTDECVEWVDELAEIDVVFHTASNCLSVSHLRRGTVATFTTGPMLGPGDVSVSTVGRWLLDYLRSGKSNGMTAGTCITDARDVAAAMIIAAETGASGDFHVAGPYVEFSEMVAILRRVMSGPIEYTPALPVSSPRAAVELSATYRPLEETLRDVVAWHTGYDLADRVA